MSNEGSNLFFCQFLIQTLKEHFWDSAIVFLFSNVKTCHWFEHVSACRKTFHKGQTTNSCCSTHSSPSTKTGKLTLPHSCLKSWTCPTSRRRSANTYILNLISVHSTVLLVQYEIIVFILSTILRSCNCPYAICIIILMYLNNPPRALLN